MYTKVTELNYRMRRTAYLASFNANTKEWTVTADPNGEKVVLKPKQLMMATGRSGKANVLQFDGMDRFKVLRIVRPNTRIQMPIKAKN